MIYANFFSVPDNGNIVIWYGFDENNQVIKLETKDENGEEYHWNAFYKIYKVKNKVNGKMNYFAYNMDADGLCYECKTLYQIEKDNSNLVVGEILKSVCDQEEEERLRENINSDDIGAQGAAHRLEYRVKGNKVTKEEYEKEINNIKERYEEVKKEEVFFGT